MSATAARLWRHDGVAATLTGHPDGSGRFTVLIDGETTPVVADMHGWQFARCCGYCDRPATVQLIDGNPDDVLCRVCARDLFDRPPDGARPIPARVIRQLYQQAANRAARREGEHDVQQATVHRIRVTGSGGVSTEFELNDGDALTVEVSGREYVGVVMPDPDSTEAVQVVVWPDEDGEDNLTFTPPGVPVPEAHPSH